LSIVTPSFPGAVWNGSTGNNWRETRADYVDPDAEDWDRISAEVIAVQEAIHNGTESGSAPSATVTAADVGNVIRQTTLTIEDLSVATVDADTNGAHGSAILYTFPEGNIHILGAVSDLTVARVGTSIEADAVVVTALGSVATANDNAALTSTEANIIPSTASTLTDGEGVMNGQSTASATLDGTSSAASCRFNVAVAADDHGASADAFLVNGTVTITWVNLGDN
jgi:hypothetical protein